MVGSKEELRQFKRSRFVFPVRIGIINPNQKKHDTIKYFHAYTDNISEGGLKVDLKYKLEVNTQLDLRFDLIINDKIHMINTNAEIRWVKKNINNIYEHGILFNSFAKDNWEIVLKFMEQYCIASVT